MKKTLLKLNIFIFLFFFIINFTFFQKIPNLYLNDYLNPFTLTFKNPKTLQMFNIIILYHYVMTFLIGVIIFTFIFIFLSFFRTYYFFNYKTFYKPQEIRTFSEFLAYFRTNLYNLQFMLAYNNVNDYIRFSIIKQKNYHLVFYKNDIKKSLNDQIIHAPLLEFLWVIFPALILVIIAYPSIILLYYNEAYIEPIFNITVIGNQWFWTYEYNDFNLLKLFRNHINNDNTFFKKKYDSLYSDYFFTSLDLKLNNKAIEREKIEQLLTAIPRRITVDCNMIIAKDPKFLRLLTTDQCLVIPAKTPIRFLITSADVIHSWAIPSYGIKIDAVPGRINQQILTIPLMGTSWGQCSELCGVNHAFMPIEIKVLAFSDFLYFMQLKIKEILLPFLVSYYKIKLAPLQKYLPMIGDFLQKYYVEFVFSKNQPIWITSGWEKYPLLNINSIFFYLLRYENPETREKLAPYIIALGCKRLNFFITTLTPEENLFTEIKKWDKRLIPPATINFLKKIGEAHTIKNLYEPRLSYADEVRWVKNAFFRSTILTPTVPSLANIALLQNLQNLQNNKVFIYPLYLFSHKGSSFMQNLIQFNNSIREQFGFPFEFTPIQDKRVQYSKVISPSAAFFSSPSIFSSNYFNKMINQGLILNPKDSLFFYITEIRKNMFSKKNFLQFNNYSIFSSQKPYFFLHKLNISNKFNNQIQIFLDKNKKLFRTTPIFSIDFLPNQKLKPIISASMLNIDDNLFFRFLNFRLSGFRFYNSSALLESAVKFHNNNIDFLIREENKRRLQETFNLFKIIFTKKN